MSTQDDVNRWYCRAEEKRRQQQRDNARLKRELSKGGCGTMLLEIALVVIISAMLLFSCTSYPNTPIPPGRREKPPYVMLMIVAVAYGAILVGISAAGARSVDPREL